MKAKDFKKQDYVLLAKLAQQTQRYQQMISYSDQILLSQQELASAQRNLCASAYKNIIATHRAQLKVIQALKNKNKQQNILQDTLNKYEIQIKKQLIKICHNFIKLIQQEVIPNKHHIKGPEATVFFKKLVADFNRYLCQYSQDSKAQRIYQDQADINYSKAQEIARSNLPQTNPVRLSLHLNMSVFLWEIMDKRQEALQLANKAFEQAIGNIDTLNQENYKECTLILQLLRDNITLWNGEDQ